MRLVSGVNPFYFEDGPSPRAVAFLRVIYNVSLRMRKVKRPFAASYLRVGNAAEIFKSPANFIKKFGAPGRAAARAHPFSL